MGTSLSKLNELRQEYIRHEPYALCVHVKELRRVRDMCVIRFLGVRGGYKGNEWWGAR